MLTELAQVGLPEIDEHRVDVGRALVYEVDNGFAGEKASFEVFARNVERGAALSVRLHQVSVLRIPCP